jgi:hypothetical protein
MAAFDICQYEKTKIHLRQVSYGQPFRYLNLTLPEAQYLMHMKEAPTFWTPRPAKYF